MRLRIAGVLVEYRRCAECGSTYTVPVEACGHARGARSKAPNGYVCLDCGHTWQQHGAPNFSELRARAGDLEAFFGEREAARIRARIARHE